MNCTGDNQESQNCNMNACALGLIDITTNTYDAPYADSNGHFKLKIKMGYSPSFSNFAYDHCTIKDFYKKGYRRKGGHDVYRGSDLGGCERRFPSNNHNHMEIELTADGANSDDGWLMEDMKIRIQKSNKYEIWTCSNTPITSSWWLDVDYMPKGSRNKYIYSFWKDGGKYASSFVKLSCTSISHNIG